jgi:hypothetical protein
MRPQHAFQVSLAGGALVGHGGECDATGRRAKAVTSGHATADGNVIGVAEVNKTIIHPPSPLERGSVGRHNLEPARSMNDEDETVAIADPAPWEDARGVGLARPDRKRGDA